jgi:hypothetical protein
MRTKTLEDKWGDLTHNTISELMRTPAWQGRSRMEVRWEHIVPLFKTEDVQAAKANDLLHSVNRPLFEEELSRRAIYEAFGVKL